MPLARIALVAAAFLAIPIAACARTPTATPVQAAAPVPVAPLAAMRPASAARGADFARQHCAQCHAVAHGQLSPNPESPPFEAVVNTPGLTHETLTDWLRASHNFPEIMNFRIDGDSIDDLAAYMLTLREPR